MVPLRSPGGATEHRFGPLDFDIPTADRRGNESPSDGASVSLIWVQTSPSASSPGGWRQPGAGADGWFCPGRFGTLAAEAYISIADQAKMVVKSDGGSIGPN